VAPFDGNFGTTRLLVIGYCLSWESRLWSMEDVVAMIDIRTAKVTGETLVG
jgi:hypothetical protein